MSLGGIQHEVLVHADPEFGRDLGSVCARRIVELLDDCLDGGRKKAIGSFLAVHRKGAYLSVVANASVRVPPCSTDGPWSFSFVDDLSREVLSGCLVTAPDGGKVLEVESTGLSEGFVFLRERIDIEDRAVARVVVGDRSSGWGVDGCEDWIFAYAKWPSDFRGQIDETPFLDGYRQFVSVGSYALSLWLDEEGDDDDVMDRFDKQLPSKVSLVETLGDEGEAAPVFDDDFRNN